MYPKGYTMKCEFNEASKDAVMRSIRLSQVFALMGSINMETLWELMDWSRVADEMDAVAALIRQELKGGAE